MNRWREWLLALVCAVCGACGAGAGGNGATPDTDGAGTVELTVDHRSEWRVLWIEGKTDLPDAAYVNYRITHKLTEAAAADDWPADNLITEGRAAVYEGQYWARINTVNWPQGQVQVLVQFPFPPQPPAVVDRYGAFGEKLTGENVTIIDGIKAVEVEYVLEHRR